MLTESKIRKSHIGSRASFSPAPDGGNRGAKLLNRFAKLLWVCAVFLTCFRGKAQALFDLSLDASSIDFGVLNVGAESPVRTIQCAVRSDIPMEWSLTMQGSPSLNWDGKSTLPTSVFRYWFIGDYPGAEDPVFHSDALVPDSAKTIYVADSSQYVTDPSVIGIGFKVLSPVQKSGRYSMRLTLMLVNNF